MIAKKVFLVFLSVLIMAGSLSCAKNTAGKSGFQAASATNTDTKSTTAALLTEPAKKAMSGTFKVIKNGGTSILLCNADAAVQDTGLYLITIDKITCRNQDGKQVPATAVTNGMILSFGYDTVLECFPAVLQGLSPIEIVRQDNDITRLYFNVIKEVYSEDSGLNGGISIISLDLSGVNTLSDKEKAALRYLVSCEYSLDTYTYTYDELVDQGLIDDKQLYFEKGILFKISDEDIIDNTFHFTISKWRSGLGAIFYEDCKAEKQTNIWKYSLGGFAIS